MYLLNNEWFFYITFKFIATRITQKYEILRMPKIERYEIENFKTDAVIQN